LRVTQVQRYEGAIDWIRSGSTGILPRTPSKYPDLLTEVAVQDSLGREVSRTSVSESLDLALFPTLGCFQPGYLLVAPSCAAMSFAALGSDELIRTQAVAEESPISAARNFCG